MYEKDKDLQHLAAIVRDSDDAIIGKTLEGIITSWNGGAERIYGYTAEEAIGRTIAMLHPLDRQDEMPKIHQKLMQGDGINHHETLRVTKNGSLVNISITQSLIRDDSGAITGISSIGRDITKQKEAEDALRESARAYKLLMEQASDAILVSYPDQPLIEVNQRASDMLGYTREELRQFRAESGSLPEGFSALPFHVDETLEGDIVYAERSVQRKDGTFIVTELSARRLDDGRIVTIARDITARKQVEVALQKKEAQLSEAQAIAHIGSWEADLATGEVIWSDELYRIYGVEPQSHKASLEAFIEYVHPDDRELARNEIEHANMRVGLFEYEVRVLRPDGSVRTVCTQGRVIGDENGKPSKAVGTGQDITDRKVADEHIQFQAEILNQVQAAVIATNMEGIITHWNRHAEKLYGWQREEALGHPIQLLTVGPADTDQAERIMAQVMDEGSWDGEFIVQRKDGSRFPAYVVDTLIRDQRGCPIGIAGISVDMTEPRQIESNLQESRERFGQAFSSAAIGMAVVGLDGAWLQVNPSLCNLVGYPESELTTKTFQDITHPDDLQADMEAVQQLLAGEIPFYHMEKRYIHRDGHAVWVLLSVSLVRSQNGAPLYFISQIQDITERRRADEAKIARDAADQANRAKSAFLSRMSHELRTPLNAILGFGQLLQLDEITPEQAEGLRYIVKAGQHLLGLINEVLDITRIEEGTLTISIEPINVRDILQESLNLLQPLAAQRQVKMRADLAGLNNCYVMADQQRLKQVMVNLLANAIKYNHEGGLINVTCSKLSYAAEVAEPGQNPQNPETPARVRILVSDSGSGLSPDMMARLFTPFDRLGAERGNVEGTGLGLVLTKHLVEAMGGAIGVDSEVGVGSTFWVELSRAEGELAQVERKETGPLANRVDEQDVRTILYIEDNLSNLRLVELIFGKRKDLRIITAMHGQMGLDMASLHMPDLILLDRQLPDMTGDEVLRQLLEDPRTRSIPVVMLSADAIPREVETLLAAGAQAYITKPINVKHLLKVIEEILARTTGTGII